jgi:diaminopimelate epimerase
MSGRSFRKMHGLGNDFVIVDARRQSFAPGRAQAAAIADRRTGVGCDQVIVMERAEAGGDLFMRVFNADGSQAEACGNATRCVASLLFAETGRDSAVIETLGGRLQARSAAGGQVTVDMGPPQFNWQAVPLAREMDTLQLDFRRGPLSEPCALSMGNPHVVFFVADAANIDLAALGPEIEYDPLFPERTNVQIVQVRDQTPVRHRVWEWRRPGAA